MAWALYNQIINQKSVQEIIEEFYAQLTYNNIVFLIIAIVLMPLNWVLESVKWRLLVNKFHKISISQSVKGILMGLSTGIASPNRIGEFAGRILVVPTEKNMLSIKSNMYNSIAQSIATYSMGVLGLFLLINRLEIYEINTDTLFVIFIAFVTITVLVYFNLTKILGLPIFNRITNFLSKWGKLDQYTFSKKDISKVIGLSFLRLLVYTGQYVLLLVFFGAQTEAYYLVSVVLVLFTIQSMIPLPPILGLLARGELGLLLFTQFNVNEITILSSTFLLWIINLLIPSLIGVVLILRTRINESIGLT